MARAVTWGVMLAAGLAASSLAAAQGAPMQLRSWAAACAACHGTNGQALPGMPAIAGAPRDELVRKLLDFKAGRAPATVMHQLARGYSDEQLQQLADYFSAQQATVPGP